MAKTDEHQFVKLIVTKSQIPLEDHFIKNS
jgi:hypothetical protein